MISVVAWLWNKPGVRPIFTIDDVNRTHGMLRRHCGLSFRLHLITDLPTRGLAPGIIVVRPPAEFTELPRCRRRMWQYAAERFDDFYTTRVLALDLDVVLTGSIEKILDRPESICGWRVGYANVLSGSFQLFDVGALDGLWQAYRADPDGYPKKTGEKNASDQAMLNYWLRTTGTKVGEWTEADGFVTYFGDGYERLEHHGVGPRRRELPPGARVVVLGSADKAVLDEGRYAWVRDHWHA